MQESVRLKSFELFAQDIDSVDVQLLHALSLSVGWSHRPKDWEFLRRAGQGIVAVDGIGRVFGSAMWFPHGDDFATIGAVITSPRTQAQGTGRWLMDQVLARCGARDLSLNATRPAYGLYLSLGFVKEAVVELLQGEVPAELPLLSAFPSPEGGLIEDLPADALATIAPLDTAAFGTDRGRLLTLLAEASSLKVLRRDGRVAAYAMCREFGRGHVIGPVVACDDGDAIGLTAAHMQRLAGRHVRVDTRSQGAFAGFLRGCGLRELDAVTTMSRGRRFLNEVPGGPTVYGLAGHALG